MSLTICCRLRRSPCEANGLIIRSPAFEGTVHISTTQIHTALDFIHADVWVQYYIYICSGSLASFSSFSPGILVKHDSGINFCCKESDKLQRCRHCLAPMQPMPGSTASLGCSTARLLIHQKSNPTKDGTTWYHHRPSRVYSFQHKLQGVRMTTLESHPTLKSAWVGRAGILKELRYSSTAHSNCMLKAVPWYMQWLTRFFFLILARNSCET